MSISEFTKVGGLQAVEERLIAVQDFESRLDELDKLAETYQVSSSILSDPASYSTGPLCSAHTVLHNASCVCWLPLRPGAATAHSS